MPRTGKHENFDYSLFEIDGLEQILLSRYSSAAKLKYGSVCVL